MLETHKLVIIDDDPDWVEFMAFQCEQLGFACSCFSSLEAASRQIKNIHPDLILMTAEYASATCRVLIDHLQDIFEQSEFVPPILAWSDDQDFHRLIRFAFDCGTGPIGENHLLSMKYMLSDILPGDDAMSAEL